MELEKNSIYVSGSLSPMLINKILEDTSITYKHYAQRLNIKEDRLTYTKNGIYDLSYVEKIKDNLIIKIPEYSNSFSYFISDLFYLCFDNKEFQYLLKKGIPSDIKINEENSYFTENEFEQCIIKYPERSSADSIWKKQNLLYTALGFI